MNTTTGTARVSATIDIHDSTDMHCLMSRRSGDIELRLGGDADAYAYLLFTRSGAEKLVQTLYEAGLSSPVRS